MQTENQNNTTFNEEFPENNLIAEEIPLDLEAPTVELLQTQIQALETQIQEEKLRAMAAEQNLRRRHEEELQNTHKFAGQKFAAEMLPVKDYLEMALQDQSDNFDALKMGVQMTLTELQKAFDNTRITEINPQAGDKLDPHKHQALQAVISEQEPNTVVSVMKKGYALADRVLRPAMVVVSKSAQTETEA
ncbi:nucleotide exchange factor GrpE [Stenoxybacter acetivorans]|uniref:nucleotide exchange factor GrpE n=1 Tax=Stenoxybacter acetivorans TaxID=422441 RepID=UPI0009FBE9DC|nr:nucleotide exchange factor GrpE [Stenoxybacter acetivorans]